MPLDLSKLTGVRRGSGKTTAQCPACAALGLDGSKQHLVIFDSGKFGCCVDNDPEHRRAIWQLAGAGTDGPVSFDPPEEPKVIVPRVWPADCLARLIKDHSYWERRHISADTVEPFRGGVATTGIFTDRYIFPQFNAEDEIIGFSGRCVRQISDADRKRFGRKKWKHKEPSSLFLWGGLDEVRDCRRAVLVESIGDALSLREHGVPESICLFGLIMSQTVLGFLISANPEHIVISTNRDVDPAKGQRAAVRIQTTLLRFFDESVVTIVHPPQREGVKDWGDCLAEDISAAFLSPAALAPDSISPPEIDS